MTRTVSVALIIGAMAGVAAMQDGKKLELLAQNREKGVEIRAPKSPGKEQMWEARQKADGFHKRSAVLVRHLADPFTVEVNVTTKSRDIASDDLPESWPMPAVIAQKAREDFTEAPGKDGVGFTECKLISEDPKAKLGGLSGTGCSHRILLTDKNGGKHELIEYFVISSDVLYRVTVSFSKESYARHWAGEAQYILHNIRRCKTEK